MIVCTAMHAMHHNDTFMKLIGGVFLLLFSCVGDADFSGGLREEGHAILHPHRARRGRACATWMLHRPLVVRQGVYDPSWPKRLAAASVCPHNQLRQVCLVLLCR